MDERSGAKWRTWDRSQGSENLRTFTLTFWGRGIPGSGFRASSFFLSSEPRTTFSKCVGDGGGREDSRVQDVSQRVRPRLQRRGDQQGLDLDLEAVVVGSSLPRRGGGGLGHETREQLAVGVLLADEERGGGDGDLVLRDVVDQLVLQAVDVADGLEDDVQLGDGRLLGDGGDEVLQAAELGVHAVLALVAAALAGGGRVGGGADTAQGVGGDGLDVVAGGGGGGVGGLDNHCVFCLVLLVGAWRSRNGHV